jgi:signal transduction histidine kinase
VTVLLIAGVSIAPLVIIGALDFYQDQQALKDEIARPLLRLTSANKHSIERYLEERSAALKYVVIEKSYEKLSDQDTLQRTFNNLRKSFGGFVDLGLIDSTGKQITYVGPYDLLGKNYEDQEWFSEILHRGMYISDIFLGYRDFPHFVIAVKHKREDGGFHILRATTDTAVLSRHIPSLALGPAGDAFIINNEGVLQTPSQFYGDTLSVFPLSIPDRSTEPTVEELSDSDGHSYMVGYAHIEQSPFISVIMRRSDDLMGTWFTLRARRLGFLAVSVGIMLILIMGTSSYLVSRIREADMRRAKLLHSVEYTNKMASVGRLAAGVAHEVNNPLAIISEKAGLVKDILSLSQDYPQREKFLQLINSILKSVDRCSSITHRLLGFSKRSDTRIATIDLGTLITEVLSFLEKEIGYRNIMLEMHVADDLPSIESDRGQLQQVFLNIINNAIEELGDGGKIDISLTRSDDGMVAATIADNGGGIAEEDLKSIFEPFFTTKMEYGTGLGLSITYGIVDRLGGSIDVRSSVGEGTSFTVTLPIHYSAA